MQLPDVQAPPSELAISLPGKQVAPSSPQLLIAPLQGDSRSSSTHFRDQQSVLLPRSEPLPRHAGTEEDIPATASIDRCLHACLARTFDVVQLLLSV